MKPIQGYHLITPGGLHWQPSNLMKIPNADFLERTGNEHGREAVLAERGCVADQPQQCPVPSVLELLTVLP
jgi:hypothetical protein